MKNFLSTFFPKIFRMISGTTLLGRFNHKLKVCDVNAFNKKVYDAHFVILCNNAIQSVGK